jgi:outer membrane protein OmpA-like peptidoglycan-associated protein
MANATRERQLGVVDAHRADEIRAHQQTWGQTYGWLLALVLGLIVAALIAAFLSARNQRVGEIRRDILMVDPALMKPEPPTTIGWQEPATTPPSESEEVGVLPPSEDPSWLYTRPGDMERTEPAPAATPEEAAKPEEVAKTEEAAKPEEVAKAEEAAKPEEPLKIDEAAKPAAGPMPPAPAKKEAAPVAAQAPLTTGRCKTVDIFFDATRSTLNDTDRRSIDELASCLRENPNAKVRVEGRSDGREDPGQTDSLAKDRARLLTEELLSRGVSPAQINKVMGNRPRKTGTACPASTFCMDQNRGVSATVE